jgi:guanine deaminase
MTEPVPGSTLAIRGALFDVRDDPWQVGVDRARYYEPDAIVAMSRGRIVDCGAAADVAPRLPPDTRVVTYANALICAGFVDAHVHYPQLPVIGAGGKPLLDWLTAYTFPAEARFGEADYARAVARRYFAENLRNGTTSAAVWCTVHPESVDALFGEAARLGVRTIAGKVMMDRNAPAALLDDAQRSYDESKALIDRWHGKDRLHYAVTPRFAATSTPEQLELAGALRREFPDVYLQSHVAENKAEVEWIRALYPERASYVDVYARFGLLGPRAIYAHGIHLDETELDLLHDTGTALAHCPTSNNFLGSGLFDVARAKDARRPVDVALATDLGGGTGFSMLGTMQAACEVAQQHGKPLAPSSAWWLATGGAACALHLGDRIGSLAPGRDADVVVLDLHSTPLIEFRMRYVSDIEQALAVQMALGDDRAVRATYVAGRLAFDRDAPLAS